jgi:hypothetical protein
VSPTAALYFRLVGRGFLAAWTAAFFVFALAAPAFGGPLRTGIVDPGAFSSDGSAETAFRRTKATGASIVKILVNWAQAAPTQPANGTDPNDPAYSQVFWDNLDNQLWRAQTQNLEAILYVSNAPRWAEGSGPGDPGTVRPDPVEFGRFAQALAVRYSGSFVPVTDPYSEHYAEPLPRVRYWQAWNEPNRDYFFMPQYDANRRLVSPAHYRAMVNRFADAVRAVDPSNVVIAGGLAPLGKPGKPAPLAFMRSFLSSPAKFDVWAHHPYTSGGPTHHALKRDDVSLGDLPEMRRVLRSAVRSGRVVSSTSSVGFWVTEFSWDSNPPDRRALPSVLHARWTSEALYRMWLNGVSLVTWFRVEDDPISASPYQSGFYTVSGVRKRSFTAFRFPFVAFTKRRGTFIWGRTPAGVPGRLVIEIKAGRRWRQLARVNSDRWGIFRRTYRTRPRRGYLRARLGSEKSLPFSLTPVADRYVNPFGCGGAIPC